MLAIYGAFGVAGTRDYFEWRRVHWAAVERVRDSGAYAVADIDGGLEFTRDNTKEVQPPTSPKVVVTLGHLPGFRRRETTPYRRLLAPQDLVVWLSCSCLTARRVFTEESSVRFPRFVRSQ